MTMGKGLNDARRVVWALGECFFFVLFDSNLCFIA